MGLRAGADPRCVNKQMTTTNKPAGEKPRRRAFSANLASTAFAATHVQTQTSATDIAITIASANIRSLIYLR